MTPSETAEALQARFGNDVLDVARFRDEVTALFTRDAIVQAAGFCRDELGYNMCSDVSCTDYLDRDPRFDVVYHITVVPETIRFRLKVQTNDGESVPTLTPIWPGANWGEREVWDLFGIEFEGHPDLRRFMMPEGWIGYPLRKDYAQTEIALPRPKSEKVGEET
ncbi:MAG TPA: NADH-quinone oxidoreductase subunit C [Chloroflexota bacterium]